MRYPKLHIIPHETQYIDAFGGYNHNTRIGDAEFYDVCNMTSDSYPLLKVRDPHGVFLEGGPHGVHGLISKDELCYVSDSGFHMGDKFVDLDLESGQKHLVSRGAYVIIFPDKKYVNTADFSDYGDIVATCSGNAAVIVNCKSDGTPIPSANLTIADVQPETGGRGKYWLDTSTTPHTMMQYSAESGEWFVTKGYIRISSEYITDAISVGDSVQLTGFVSEGVSLDGFYSIAAAGIDTTSIGTEKRYVAIPGTVPKTHIDLASEFSMTRDVPDMDFVIEANNRLWGCKYGVVDGKIVNEIYASKLGDFRNWRNYAGISTDSYAASVGTDGPFTGAVNFGGYPLFFKERCVHKVYGTMPSNFQIQTDVINGVQKGCEKSLAVVNDVLYYKSLSGVCAYDGSLPVIISEKLGQESYKQAVAGGLGNKYYITMKQLGVSYDFIYDTSKGIWHRSQIPQSIVQYCAHGDEMYFLTDTAFDDSFIGTTLKQTSLKSHLSEKNVFWHAESGMLGLETAEKKSLVSMNVRIKVAFGTKVRYFIEYDSSGHWEPVCSTIGRGVQIINMPIIPRPCDHFRIKIEGEGPATLFSICKTLEEGPGV